MSGWRSGDDTAIELGRLLAVESALHQLLGSAALLAHVPMVVCALDEQAMLHADHVAALVDHLPRRDGVDRAALQVLGPLDAAWPALGAMRDEPLDLLFAYRQMVLPRLLEAVIALEVGCSLAAERSLKRSLGATQRDLEDSIDAMDRLLARLGCSADDERPSVVAAGRLFVTAAGPLGLGF